MQKIIQRTQLPNYYNPIELYTYVCLHVHTHGHTHIYIHILTHTHTHTHTRTHAHIHVHTYTYTYMHTYAHIHTCTYTHTYTHMHTHAHIHTQYLLMEQWLHMLMMKDRKATHIEHKHNILHNICVYSMNNLVLQSLHCKTCYWSELFLQKVTKFVSTYF